MKRREAISAISCLLGGSILGANLFLQFGCTPSAARYNTLFDVDEVTLLDEIAETILPETSTPGAREAKAGEFIALFVQDCYEYDNQRIFKNGLDQINETSEKLFLTSFINCQSAQRHQLLVEMDKEQRKWHDSKTEEAPSHFFRMMKELTLLSFFTSETGATKALRYMPVPGRFDGCIPYKKGDRAWA